jgi:ubiquinone/menaquinone biosynthesis C-methylase UbiE
VSAAPSSLPRALDPLVKRVVVEDDFYARTVASLLQSGVMRRDMRVLVACGGTFDKAVLLRLGFSDVVISNLDPRLDPDEFAPYRWSYQDVEHLTFENEEFDFAVVHNGLHHCYSPHKGLLELYRVARRGVLVFEPRDTALVRLGIRWSFGQKYEVASVTHNGLSAGGVGNSRVPNYIYRWTEREVEKTILSYAPYGEPRFQFMYALRVPWGRLLALKNPLFLTAVVASLPALKLLFRVFPRQANGFGFAIEKPQLPRDLHPWLSFEDNHINVRGDWMRHRYEIGK